MGVQLYDEIAALMDERGAPRDTERTASYLTTRACPLLRRTSVDTLQIRHVSNARTQRRLHVLLPPPLPTRHGPKYLRRPRVEATGHLCIVR